MNSEVKYCSTTTSIIGFQGSTFYTVNNNLNITMRKTYQYKLKLTAPQRQEIDRWLDMLRHQYNYLLAQRYEWWKYNRSNLVFLGFYYGDRRHINNGANITIFL
jgi:hypothetical protein